jgi:hypothetical protein
MNKFKCYFYFLIITRLVFFLLILVTPGPAAEARHPEMPVITKQLYTHVHQLSSIQPPRNYKNPSSLDRAAAYIFKEFSKWGKGVEVQRYHVNGTQYKNVIAWFGPKTGKRIVIGAHYDVYGDQPGADDNAGGVAALLELAGLFSRLKPGLKQRIDLAAYPLEEPPFFRTPNMGSAVHAESLAAANVKIRIMISLDMIGYFSDNVKPFRSFAPFFKPGTIIPGNTTAILGKQGEENITQTLAKYIMKYSDIHAAAVNPPPETPGIDFSDHLNFWKQGYKAVMITNFLVCPNLHYHQPGDTIDKLDFNRMAEIVKGLYGALCKMASRKPGRWNSQ